MQIPRPQPRFAEPKFLVMHFKQSLCFFKVVEAGHFLFKASKCLNIIGLRDCLVLEHCWAKRLSQERV